MQTTKSPLALAILSRSSLASGLMTHRDLAMAHGMLSGDIAMFETFEMFQAGRRTFNIFLGDPQEMA